MWISGVYGKSRQKETNDALAYKAKGHALAMGFYFNFSEKTIFGISYTKTNSRFKLDKLNDSRIHINSHIFSLYGKKSFANNFVLRGIVSYVNPTVDYNILLDNNGDDSKARYKTQYGGMMTQLGYQASLMDSKLQLLPTIGFKYNTHHASGYSETGTGLYNLNVSGTRHKDLSLNTGLEMSYTAKISD